MQDDIVYELKAVKNDCEIQGMKQAHVNYYFTIYLI
jgi:Xaa-Pro aminopeptidase